MVTGWQALSKGDIIDIVAPSSANFDLKSLSQIVSFIEELGFTPRLPADMIKTKAEMLLMDEDPFCSNSDDYRFNHLRKVLFAEDSKAIWCIRGGYGAARIVEELIKLKEVPRRMKLFIGFSDITVLHIFLNQFWGWQTIHAKVLTQFTNDRRDDESVEQIRQILQGKQQLNYQGLVPLNNQAKHSATVKGELAGGNLCLIECSLGTKWQLNTKNKILFLEDISERAYAIDRSFEHLWQAGIFSKIKALILGEFTDYVEKDADSLFSYAINRLAKKLAVPVFGFDQLGHGQKNVPLPIGTNSKIVIDKQISLVCASGVSN